MDTRKTVVAAVIVGGVTLLLFLAAGLYVIARKLPAVQPELHDYGAAATAESVPVKQAPTRSSKFAVDETARPVQTAAVSEAAPVSEVADTAVPPPSAVPSPTPEPTATVSVPRRLAYVMGSVGSSDIYVADADGRNRGAVAARSCDEAEPAWSPDGQWVIYQSNCAGSYDIWTVPSSGGTLVQLTTTSSVDEREPDWSQRGDLVIYRTSALNSARNDDGELWTMNANGSNQRRLDDTVIMGRSPVWSPDGEAVLFMSQRSGLWQIYLYDMTSRETRRLTNCQTNCRWPCWSPDGQSVAYHSTVSASGQESATADTIWKLSLSGGSPARVISDAHAGRPSWSWEGQIIFNSDYGLEVVRVSGEGRGVLIGGEENWAPCWSR